MGARLAALAFGAIQQLGKESIGALRDSVGDQRWNSVGGIAQLVAELRIF
jgi:hypothetical protein